MSNDNFWEQEESGVMSEEEANQILAKEVETEESAQEEYEFNSVPRSEVIYEQESEEIDDEAADLEVLQDAELRLSQGNLYQMLLKHDLFEGVDADARAIKNVQREIRSFIRERLQILVGLKVDPRMVPKTVVHQSPFSELEIQLLKQLLAKATGGNAPKSLVVSQAPSPTPTNQAIKPIIGSYKQNKKVSVVPKQSAKPKLKPAEQEDSKPKKTIAEMSAKELLEYNKQIAEKQRKKKAIPPNKAPMPPPDRIGSAYANNMGHSAYDTNTSVVNAIMALSGKQMQSIQEVDRDMPDWHPTQENG